MKTEEKQPKLITLENGKEAVNFLPEHEGIAALVDLVTLQRLISSLPSAYFSRTKDQFIDAINDTENLDSYLEVVSNELAFHMTVNKIARYEVKKDAAKISAQEVDVL
jgi:hypothetical protein